MNIIETHAHIYLDQFEQDIDEVLTRTKDARVSKVIMPNIDQTSIAPMLELEKRYPNFCMSTMGLHPCSVKDDFEKELEIVADWLNKRPFAAVGEIGTDLYWDKSYWPQQQVAFKTQCQWAVGYDLPVIIHSRESIDETIDLVANLSSVPKGIFHCFTGSVKQAEYIIEMGFLLGIGGVATFKNGGLEPVLKEIPLEHMVLETDSPYLAPVPHRGKRNEPSYLPLIVDKISGCRSIDPSEVIEVTTQAASKIFKLDHV